MSSNALEAQGMKIQRGNGAATEIFADIPEIKTFSGPGGSASVIDTTDLSSAAKEKRMGLMDEGQVQMSLNYVPSEVTHAGLRADRASRVLRNFKIVFTDDPITTWSFSAYVLSFAVAGAVDGVVEATVTLEITGAIVES